ncbi:MAG TPA: hypothetical protein VFA07_13650 [Chthonomonadaceae bacterium]|nr:hypothetical protein [Chthonomonadaceae bacterium]
MNPTDGSGSRCFVCCIPIVLVLGLALFLIAFSWHRMHRPISRSAHRPAGRWAEPSRVFSAVPPPSS